MAAPQASSRLEMLQARFQQRQLIEKEQKLLQLYDQQQLRAHQVAQRGSAGSTCSNSSGHGTNGTTSHHHQTVTRTSTTTQSTSNTQGGGKVRQMFDERRQTTVKGIDKSYPLEPLDNRSRKQQSTTCTTSNVVVSSTSPMKNGNPMSNRQSVVTRRTVRSEANSNINGGKPIVSYHEEVTRESCGPTEDVNDREEYGDENDQISRYANGNPHVDQRSGVHIEDVTNESTTQRHRTTAKIHLAGFDGDSGTNIVGDDLDNERFPDVRVTSVPDRLPRRGPPAKKPSQAEARLERFKNTNTNRAPGKTTKQVAGNTTSFTKKRTETTTHSGSTSRASTVTRTMEEDSSRRRSTSPELVSRSGRPSSSSPEVADRETSSASPVIDRRSIVKSSPGISKVSQLTHKDSMDFYPRRKSEFEKSKTFRKLQLELGESSPEPAEPEPETTGYPRQCRKRGSILEPNIYSSDPRSSSSSPAADRDRQRERGSSHDRTPEAPKSRGGSESPIYQRKSATTRDDTKTRNAETSVYSCQRSESSSTYQTTDRDIAKRTDREKSPEQPRSRRGSVSPIYDRKSSLTHEEVKRSSAGDSTFSSRRHSSSPSPSADRDLTTGRRTNREKSTERPSSRRGSESPIYDRKSSLTHEETKKSSVEDSTFSSRCHSSLTSQVTDRDLVRGRRTGHLESAERPSSRRGSESPVYDRKSSLTHEETKRSSVKDSTYSSRRHSSSTSPSADRDLTRGRRTSHEKSAERPSSRSESPIYDRKSSLTHEETKRSSVKDSTYSSRRHSSSPSPTADHDLTKGRRTSREKSTECPSSRRGFESPIYDRKSSLTHEETKRSSVKDSTYLSRRRSSSASPTADRDFSNRRRASHESSPERPASRSGSESPVYRRKSTVTSEQITTIGGRKTTSTERRVTREEKTSRKDNSTCVRTARKRSESPHGDFRRSSVDQKSRSTIDTRKKSGETLRSFELVKKLVQPVNPEAKSTITTKRSIERKTTLEDVEFPVYTTDQKSRSKSPVHKIVKKDKAVMRPSKEGPKTKVTDRKNYTDIRDRNVRSRSRTISPSPPRSTKVKSSLGEGGFPVHSVDRKDPKRRTKSPEHKIMRKDKAAMEPSKKEPKVKVTDRKNSSDTIEKIVISKSRSVSPTLPSSTTMKETTSFRAKKTERRDSVEDKEESKNRQERRIVEMNMINLSNEKRWNCEQISKTRSPSPQEDRTIGSRRSSSDTTVKRHDTFKVSRPSQRIMRVESSVDTDEESIGKRIKTDSTDKSQLLERIENIRSTISKSGGRSVQSLESKDFERTDSVESALRRFDSIGVETEHHVTVGVDEPDILPTDSAVKETTDVAKIVTKKSVDCRSKSGKITVGVVKAQPRKIDAKPRADSREKHSESVKSAKIGKERSARAKTPQSDDKAVPKSRVGRKIGTSIVRKSMLRREDEPSGRGEGKDGDRSPSCKRRLFEDSESEIDTDNSRSTVVLSTIVRVTKRPEIGDDRDDRKTGASVARSVSPIGDSKADVEQPTKVLRSIEDIRKSIKRESQDFKRELCKFNTAMKREVERSASGRTDTTARSGIISRVEIKKSFKTGDDEPVVEIKRTTVKLPIAHRVAKSPSPDIGTKRTTDQRRARTPTASVRRSVPSSPAKSPDATVRYGSTELKSAGSKLLSRPSTSPSSLREDGNRSGSSRTSVHSDFTDGPGSNFQSTVTECVFSVATKTHETFVVGLDDDGVSRGKDGALPKPPLQKKSSDRSLTASQRQQRSPTGTPLPRPASALSTVSSAGSARGNSKVGMATKTKSPTSTAPKLPPGSARVSTTPAVNDGLAPCKICGRRFNNDRISLHEQICSKTATKKRKQFDATIHRVKGTELEPFVKKAGSKKPQADRKSQKPEVKSNWRRKHEDFINAIRSAKQVQAHLAAGGKLSDLPPPPASDTSDYVQCPHCGRKFNQGAAERHIPKCQNMLHNKPNPRAPPKPKR